MTKGQANKLNRHLATLRKVHAEIEAIYNNVSEKYEFSSTRAQNTAKGNRRYMAIQDMGITLEYLESTIDALIEAIEGPEEYRKDQQCQTKQLIL